MPVTRVNKDPGADIHQQLNDVVKQAVLDAANRGRTTPLSSIKLSTASNVTRGLIFKNLQLDDLLNKIYAKIRVFPPETRSQIIQKYIRSYDNNVNLPFGALTLIKFVLRVSNHPDWVKENTDLLDKGNIAARAQRVLDLLDTTPLAKADANTTPSSETMQQRSSSESEQSSESGQSDATPPEERAKRFTKLSMPKLPSTIKATLSKLTFPIKSKKPTASEKQEEKQEEKDLDAAATEVSKQHQAAVANLQKLAHATKDNLPKGAKFSKEANYINAVITKLDSRSSDLDPDTLIDITTEVLNIGAKIASEEPTKKSHNSFAASFKYLANMVLESLSKLLEALVALKNTVLQAMGLGGRKDLVFSSKERSEEQQQLKTVKKLKNSMRISKT